MADPSVAMSSGLLISSSAVAVTWRAAIHTAAFAHSVKAETKRPRTHREAEKIARRVYSLRSIKMTQAQIACHLGLTRSNVAKYLAPDCKAALRAGLIS